MNVMKRTEMVGFWAILTSEDFGPVEARGLDGFFDAAVTLFRSDSS